MKRFTSKSQKIGEYGERICCAYLLRNGYSIIKKNYTLATGEIDIIAKKDKVLYFIEVKSVTHETSTLIMANDYYNPAENVTREKIAKCYRVIREYKDTNNVSCETQFDVYMVYIDPTNQKHFIEIIPNVF